MEETGLEEARMKKIRMEETGITHADKAWLPFLKSLWMAVYEDTGEEIDEFFHTFFEEELSWCATEGGKPVSAIYGIPAGVWRDNFGRQISPLIYLYAGATDPARRGKGYYGELLRYICREQRGMNAGGRIPVLSPVPELVSYYERLGFKQVTPDVTAEADVWAEADKKFLTPGMLTPPDGLSFTTLDAAGYKVLRDRLLGRAGYVEWEERFLAYAIRGAVRSGGGAWRIAVKGKGLEKDILKGKCLEGEDLEGEDLEEKDLEGEGLEGKGLEGKCLKGKGLEGEDLEGEGLKGKGLEGKGLEGEGLKGKDLEGKGLEGRDLEGKDLKGKDLEEENLERKFREQGKEALLLAVKSGTCLKIVETTLPEPLLHGISPWLRERFACERLELKRTPLMSAGECWPGSPYFAIALDE